MLEFSAARSLLRLPHIPRHLQGHPVNSLVHMPSSVPAERKELRVGQPVGEEAAEIKFPRGQSRLLWVVRFWWAERQPSVSPGNAT